MSSLRRGAKRFFDKRSMFSLSATARLIGRRQYFHLSSRISHGCCQRFWLIYQQPTVWVYRKQGATSSSVEIWHVRDPFGRRNEPKMPRFAGNHYAWCAFCVCQNIHEVGILVQFVRRGTGRPQAVRFIKKTPHRVIGGVSFYFLE